MRTKFALAAALALAFTPTPSFAAAWSMVGTSTLGTTYEIDRETVSRDGVMVTFWLRVKYGPGSPGSDVASGYSARRRANCTERSYNDMQTIYSKDGKMISEAGEEEKIFAAPDSIAAAVIKAACGN